jgi:hypothetical protein
MEMNGMVMESHITKLPLNDMKLLLDGMKLSLNQIAMNVRLNELSLNGT